MNQVDSFPELRPMPRCGNPSRGRRGFTVLELLTVIAIMMVVSTILVASFFGMGRAAAYTTARNAVFNTLHLARQRALMDGSRVFFMLIDSNSFVLVHGAGTLSLDAATGPGGRMLLFDAYSDLTNFVNSVPENGVRIWNMSRRSNQYVSANVVKVEMVLDSEKYLVPPEDGGTEYSRLIYHIETEPTDVSKWKQGDRYGFELYPRQELSKGFYLGFEGLETEPKNDVIVFRPDGGTEGYKDGCTEVYIYEKIKQDEANAVKIEVANPSGTIKVKP
ncbi:MAG: type II secretion system protein [Kiritimatiellae bacterium]|nr:type II secretion system protein [Kiritimatiellia bacterium]